MPDKLGTLMNEYSRVVRRYRSWGLQQIEAIAGLSERDTAILEYVFHQKEATFAQIAREMNVADFPKTSTSTISLAISALYVKHKLLDKRLNPDDQRQPIVTLTEKGKKAVENLIEFRRNYLIMVRDSMELTEEESQVMEKAFARGIKNFQKICNITAVK